MFLKQRLSAPVAALLPPRQARYAYAPLSVPQEEDRRRLPHGAAARMPTFVGVCVLAALVAIALVLGRSPQQASVPAAVKPNAANAAAGGVAAVPEGTAQAAQQQGNGGYVVPVASRPAAADGGPVIQAVPNPPAAAAATDSGPVIQVAPPSGGVSTATAAAVPEGTTQAVQQQGNGGKVVSEENETVLEEIIDMPPKSRLREHQSSSLSFGSPFVILTEGGCSGTTALGKYIKAIVHRHGFDKTEGVGFEFTGKYKPSEHNIRNSYIRDIAHERNITLGPYNDQYYDLVLESLRRAQAAAVKTKTLLFFKINVKRYSILGPQLDALEPAVAYAGFYRENVLDRCICMLRDCFFDAKAFGTAVFGHNGTETDLCFGRRKHPEWNVQAKFTNVEQCLEEDQNQLDVVKGQDFHSFTDNELFRFETSTGEDDFQSSVDAWMKFLRPLLQGELKRETVASVLEEWRGTRLETSSQESKVYNYVELKEELIGSLKWETFLHH